MELAELDAQIAWVDDQLALIGDAPAVESEVLCSVLSLRERVDALAMLATAAWDRAERWRADGGVDAGGVVAASRAARRVRGQSARAVGPAGGPVSADGQVVGPR